MLYYIAIGLMIISSILSGLAPVYLKKSSYPAEKFGYKYNVLHRLNLLIGVILYGISNVIGIIAFKFGEVSILYPFMALSYIWVCLFSMKILKEKMNINKWIGISFIIIGVICIGGSV